MLSNAPLSATLPAVDIERAKKFYAEKLGLKESASQEPGGVTFDCGNGTQLYIYQRAPVKVEHTLASFMVKDLAAEMTELRGRGVVFEEYDFPGLKTVNGIADMGGFKAAWFKDSEGNILGIGQSAK
jgi:predicted enzyme related to lactoylglutathione lyase